MLLALDLFSFFLSALLMKLKSIFVLGVVDYITHEYQVSF